MTIEKLNTIEYYPTNAVCPGRDRQGNASFCAVFSWTDRGSLTVEASLAFPIVLAVLLSVLQLIGTSVFQARLQTAMTNVGRRLSYYYYAVEEIKGKEERSLISSLAEGVIFFAASETVIRGMVMEELTRESIPEHLIERGQNGISFFFSHYDPESETIFLTARYNLKIPVLSLLPGIPMYQGTAHRIWTGRPMEESTNEELVYVTEGSKVYHTHLSCGSLSLRIKELPFQQVSSARNSSGEIYRACEFCGNGSGATAYVSVYGNRYHFDRNCSGLKRSVGTIPVSEIGDRTLCKRCAKKGE